MSERQRRGAAVDNNRVAIFNLLGGFLANQVLIIGHLYRLQLKAGLDAGAAG